MLFQFPNIKAGLAKTEINEGALIFLNTSSTSLDQNPSFSQSEPSTHGISHSTPISPDSDSDSHYSASDSH